MPVPPVPEPTPDPDTSLRAYLPPVPTLPSMRKYLFSSPSSAPTTDSPSSPRRRHHNNNNPGPSDRSAEHSPTHRPVTDCPGLRELIALVDKALGPVGQLQETLAKRIPHDRMLEALNSSVHNRNRILVQFLRARQHNASEAFNMITNSLRWRKSVDIEIYLKNPTHTVAVPPTCFPMFIISTPQSCKQPIVYGLIRLLDRKAERIPFQNALISFLESGYYGDTYVLDEMIIILDFRGWSIRKNAPYRLVKDGIQILQDYYPERLGRVFLVNYPTSIRAAYTVVSPVIDAGAKEKIVWIPDEDPSVTLRKYLAPKAIPSFLGGDLQATFPPSWPDVEAEFAASRASQGRSLLHS